MKQDYMARLSRAARWMLPPDESEEVIADYLELVTQNPRPEETLYRELGNPVEAVRLLADRKPYRRWLCFFVGMAACLIPFPLALLSGNGLRAVFGHADGFRVFLPLVSGAALSHWYWHRNPQKEPFPKTLAVWITVLLAVCAGMGFYLVYLFRSVETGTPFPVWLYGRFHIPLNCVCGLAAVPGWYALTMARMEDRRWRAFYILALTAASISAASLLLFTSLNLTPGPLWVPFARNYAIAATIGLTASAAALR